MFFASILTFAQGKKPTLMILPSDNWCVQRYFTIKYEDESGRVIHIPDYQMAFQQDAELSGVISLIGQMLTDRGYDFMQFVVNISPKSGIGSVQHLIRQTLLSLSISEQEANEYREMNMPVSKWRFNGELFSLRNDQQFINSCRFKLIEIQNEYFRGISFIDNMGVESAPGKYIFTDVRYKEDKLPRFGPDAMYGYTIETGTGLLNPFYEIFGHMEYFSSPDYLDDGYRRYNDAETYSSLSVGSSTLLFSFLMPKNEIAKYSNFKVEIRNE